MQPVYSRLISCSEVVCCINGRNLPVFVEDMNSYFCPSQEFIVCGNNSAEALILN
jgi:hypothetical protein